MKTKYGLALEHSTNRSREEEVLLHRLRVNRCNNLAKTEHLFGRIESSQCRQCNSEEVEDTEHFILKCDKWNEERMLTLGSNPLSQFCKQIRTKFYCLLAKQDVYVPHIIYDELHQQQQQNQICLSWPY